MLDTVEAVLHPNGALNFLEPVQLHGSQRVLVTFIQLQDEAVSGAALSQASLGTDWLHEDEDAAWAHLQPAGSVLSYSVTAPNATRFSPPNKPTGCA